MARVVDRELTDRLRTAGAVVIQSPRACGKTATAMQVAASRVISRNALHERLRGAVPVEAEHVGLLRRVAAVVDEGVHERLL